jgi:hypothetical protein
LNPKRFGLTLFFVILSLSIGLISINSPLPSANAQNSALSQKGINNEAEQATEQSQDSEQDNQVISGDNSILSGNNIQCNSQINSKTVSGISDAICAIGGLNIPDANENSVKIKLIIKFDVDPECVPGRSTNHGCNGHGGNYMIYSGTGTGNIFRGDVTVGEGQSGKTIEVALPYDRTIGLTMTASNPFLNPNGYEVISSRIDSKADGYDCIQRHIGVVETIGCTTFNATMDGQEKVFSFTFKIIDRF